MMHNHLSLSTSATHFSVSASSSSFTVDYLTNKCGFLLKSAIATSRKLEVNEKNIERSDAVISLFKSYGFDDTHISKIIQMKPLLLIRYKVDENLKTKLEYLVENGFSGPLLHELVVSDPRLLGASLTRRIKPSLNFLRSFLGTEEGVKLAVKRNSRLLSNNLKATLQPKIALLVKEGVPVDAVAKFLVSYPSRMQPNVDRLVSALQIVKLLLNMHPTDPKFLLAVTSVASISDSVFEKKLQLFKSFGFSQQEALSIFKLRPDCLSLSEENLRTKLGFYFNTAKLKIDDIISYPNLVVLSLERRIRPRHNVLKLLLSKKLLKEDTKITRIFAKSEKEFLSKYVTSHLQQVPTLLEMYSNDIALAAIKKIGII